jgi:two-component system nitrate/nitrite response regulator NarL
MFRGGGVMPYSQRSSEDRIQVVVADKSRIHTQLLADALRKDPILNVTALPSDPWQIAGAPELLDAHVALVSTALDEEPTRCLAVLRELRLSHPTLRIVALLESSRRELVQEVFRAGVRGVFSQQESVENLCKCVRAVYEGQIWANSVQTSFLLDALSSSPTVRAVDANGFNLLSKRELEVVQSLAEGLTNREIGKKLGLSQHTIKNYLFRVFDKLGVSSRIELLFLTLSQGIPPQASGSPIASPSGQEAAVLWCQQAAEQGITAAQLALALMYWEGKFVPRDPVSAYKWYLISKQTDAALERQIDSALPAMLESLNEEQRTEAEQSAVQWLKRAARKPCVHEEGESTARNHLSAGLVQ